MDELSAAGDDRYRALFLEILCLTDAGPRIDRSYFSTERLAHGRFSGRFYERLGLKDGDAIEVGDEQILFRMP